MKIKSNGKSRRRTFIPYNTHQLGVAIKKCIFLAAIVPLLTINSSAFAQGALTPPGPPGPTMLTLSQVEPRTPISSLPYVITAPGSYFLTTNLTGVSGSSGITVQTNNVTIDLRGFTLIGVPGALDGINANSLAINSQNLVVKNGAITGWPQNGLDADASVNSHFSDLNLVNNTYDGLNPGAYAVVRNCVAANNGLEGFGGLLDQYCLFEDCIGHNSGDAGFIAGSNCSFRDCSANNDGGAGFRSGYTSSFENCTAAEDGTGFDVQNASCIFEHCNCQLDGTGVVTGDECTLRDVIADYSFGDGIDTGQSCVLESCNASESSDGGGINVSNSCTLTDCVAATNQLDNFTTLAGCILTHCVASGSVTGNGFTLGPGNTISGCSATGNSGAGIYVTNAPGCRIEGNTLDFNYAAMVIAPNNQAFILRNSADANVFTNYSIGTGNSWGPIVNATAGGDISTIPNSSHPDANFIH